MPDVNSVARGLGILDGFARNVMGIMKIKSALGFVIAITLVSVTVYLVFNYWGNRDQLPAHDLEGMFAQKRESLHRLVDVLAENSKLNYLSGTMSDGTFNSQDSTEIDTDTYRAIMIAEYQPLLDAAGVIYISRETYNGIEIFFFTVQRTELNSTQPDERYSEEMGFAFSPKDRLDFQSFSAPSHENNIIPFKFLEPNWYLFRRVRVGKPE